MSNTGSFENPKSVPTTYWLFTFLLIQISKVLVIEETKNPITVEDGEFLYRDGRAFKQQQTIPTVNLMLWRCCSAAGAQIQMFKAS